MISSIFTVTNLIYSVLMCYSQIDSIKMLVTNKYMIARVQSFLHISINQWLSHYKFECNFFTYTSSICNLTVQNDIYFYMNTVCNCIYRKEEKKKRSMIATAFTHIACGFVGQTFVIRCHDFKLSLFI